MSRPLLNLPHRTVNCIRVRHNVTDVDSAFCATRPLGKHVQGLHRILPRRAAVRRRDHLAQKGTPRLPNLGALDEYRDDPVEFVRTLRIKNFVLDSRRVGA
jgi:hypothetical protein